MNRNVGLVLGALVIAVIGLGVSLRVIDQMTPATTTWTPMIGLAKGAIVLVFALGVIGILFGVDEFRAILTWTTQNIFTRAAMVLIVVVTGAMTIDWLSQTEWGKPYSVNFASHNKYELAKAEKLREKRENISRGMTADSVDMDGSLIPIPTRRTSTVVLNPGQLSEPLVSWIRGEERLGQGIEVLSGSVEFCTATGCKPADEAHPARVQLNVPYWFKGGKKGGVIEITEIHVVGE